ncbi:unnamed protein product [Brassicogethes aeneus]|uniref:Uncharacterized protein n=1 Tax=Brassicogethes aeneus TaxID=1431903 RepID=A0A9P0BJG4_BRAAE|nr:unnamed protein product [Brassicogethes aeneus]
MKLKILQNVFSLICQLFAIFPAILLNIPFGMMLAWPSPTYPRYLLESSPIPIDLDQSAMIAGFLMIGLSVATPLSSATWIGPKNSMTVGSFLMTLGWIVLWRANSIYLVLLGRFITGFGYGFCVSKIKKYISEMCEKELSSGIINLTMPATCVGVITMFSYGNFVKLEDVSVIASIISACIFCLVAFLPHTPKEFIQSNNLKYAKHVIEAVNPKANVQEVINKMKMELSSKEINVSFLGILKDSNLRLDFFNIAILTFFQQFTGVPSTIIYCQIMFSKCKVEHPIYMSMVYVIFFLFGNILGIFVTPKIQ